MFDFSTFLESVGKPLILTGLVPIVVYVAQKGYTAMPAWMKPVLAGLAGPALAQLADQVDVMEVTGSMQVISGLAGIGIREVFNQLITKKAMPIK